MRLPAAALFVVATALLGAALDARVALRGDRSFDLSAARTVIDAHKKPGDLFVHSPLFDVSELAALGALNARPDLPSKELMNSRRVLVIDVKDQPMYGFGAPDERIEINDQLVLLVFEPEGGAAPILFDLRSSLGQAKMRIERPIGTVTSECNAPRAEGGRSCPGEPDWLYLADRTLNIQGKPEPCVWAHPTTGGAIVIQLPPMAAPPPGRKTELTVTSAMDDAAVTGTPDGASVMTEIQQGGKAIERMVLRNRLGWERTTVTIAPNEPTDLVVTTARDGRRHHCINAVVREVEVE